MSRKKLYRVKAPGQTALRDPDTREYVVPDPTKPYPEDDPLVVAYPDFFVADEDRVEATTSNPGEKRRVGRPPLPRDSHGNVIRGD